MNTLFTFLGFFSARTKVVKKSFKPNPIFFLLVGYRTSNEHDKDAEYLLVHCVTGDVPEAHRRQGGGREVQCRHVRVHLQCDVIRSEQFESGHFL